MKKKVISVLLSAVLAAGALSTGIGTQTVKAETENAADIDTSEFVELSMYVIGDRPAGQDVNDEYMNEIFKEKLNCSLTINWIPWADYLNKYPLLFTSGEEFDMAYTATWLNFSSLAQKGAFMELDDIWPEYAPKNYAAATDTAKKQATVQGHIYCIPSQLATYSAYGTIYRGDILEEAGLDEIKNFDDVEAYCDYVKKAHPDMEPLDISSVAGSLFDILYLSNEGYSSVSSGGINEFLYYDPTEEQPQLKTMYEVEDIKNYLEMMSRWNEKGFFGKSALADTDSTKFQNGKAALTIHNLDNYRDQAILNPDWNLQYTNFVKNIAHMPYTQDALVISNTSRNPERALALWDLITTDQEVYDAFMYGIEGTTYELNDDGQYNILDTGLYAAGNCWAARTNELNRNVAGTPSAYEDFKVEFEKKITENDSAEKYASFVPDTSSIEVEYAACQSVNQQYWWPLELGYTDMESGLEEYKAQMEAAGIEKVREELQRQLDEYTVSINE